MSKQGVPSYNQALADLDKFMAGLTKAAGSDDSTSAHPTASEDNQTSDRKLEGSHASELEADISDKIPNNINDAEPAGDKKIGPEQQTEANETGKDVPSVKMTKDDPDSSHPSHDAKEASAFLARVKSACAKFGPEAVASEIGNSIMADISVMCEDQTKQAAAAGSRDAEQLVKQAEAEIAQLTPYLVKRAQDAAALLHGYYAHLEKQAAEEGQADPEAGVPGEGEEAAGDAGGEGALPSEDLEQLAAVAGPEAAGGMPADAGMSAGAAPAGATGDAEVIDALSQALADAGVTPEELAQAVAAEQQGPKMASVSLEERVKRAEVAKLAASEVNRYRNLKAVGRIQTKQAGLSLTWAMRSMIKDVMGK
jgi:hypothetical protein